MRPAGAILPFDAESGARLRLSWEAGVDAWLYFELVRAVSAVTTAAAGDEAATGGEAVAKAAGRSPDRFDWPRFRALLHSEDIGEPIRADPWRADWETLAARTVASGWDRRRIRLPETAPLTLVIPHDGPWIGSSPFADTENWEAGEQVTLEAGKNIDTYLSSGGMLRYAKGAWMWIPIAR
jgi:hypothetical protein